jgi:dehydrogenase/reductase SDR family protein 12
MKFTDNPVEHHHCDSILRPRRAQQICFLYHSKSMGSASTSGFSKVALAQWYLEGRRLYGPAGYEATAKTFSPGDLADMTGKSVVITGANRGLGLATAKALAGLNAEVHMLCRDSVKGEAARDEVIRDTNNKNIFIHQCDVSSFAGVRKFAAGFETKFPRVDVLINNAGSLQSQRTLTDEGNESSVAAAIGGTHLLTDLLLPSLKRTKGRVINVTSAGAYLTKSNPLDIYCSQLPFDGQLFYAFAKRMQIDLTEMWAARLKDSGVTVNSMHPGWASTEGAVESLAEFHAQNAKSFRTTEQGADTIVFLASNQTKVAGRTGLFWFDRNPVRTHMPFGGTQSSAEELALLWKVCSESVGGISEDSK